MCRSMLTGVGASVVVGGHLGRLVGGLGEPGAGCHPGKRTQLRLLGTPGREGIPLKQGRWGKAWGG